jgi:hypothetical protein
MTGSGKEYLGADSAPGGHPRHKDQISPSIGQHARWTPAIFYLVALMTPKARGQGQLWPVKVNRR